MGPIRIFAVPTCCFAGAHDRGGTDVMKYYESRRDKFCAECTPDAQRVAKASPHASNGEPVLKL
jgi:hypothetical protein